jgi:hypothetical protein
VRACARARVCVCNEVVEKYTINELPNNFLSLRIVGGKDIYNSIVRYIDYSFGSLLN